MTDTLQFMILTRDPVSAFHVDEQSAALRGLKSIMTGEHLSLEVNTCFFGIWLVKTDKCHNTQWQKCVWL